jgi:hypothetical protein
MTKEYKKTLKLMKKVDSKLNYKKLHLEPIKEMENSKNLKGEFYVNSVLDDMSYEELYG